MQILEKLNNGEELTPGDWEKYLLDAHQQRPSITPQSFSPFLNTEGVNSYDFLAEMAKIQPGHAILDLGCGDGFLINSLLGKIGSDFKYIGVDMSKDELRNARQNFAEFENIQFIQSRAQAINIQNRSMDHVLSHMAFMLMNPIDEVLQEIQRVLKGGGWFSAVVGSRESSDQNLIAIREIVSKTVSAELNYLNKIPTGDPRTRTAAGLQEAFACHAGFINFSATPFEIEVGETPEAIWDFFEGSYFVELLSKEAKINLRGKILDISRSLSVENKICVKYPLLFFTVQKDYKQ